MSLFNNRFFRLGPVPKAVESTIEQRADKPGGTTGGWEREARSLSRGMALVKTILALKAETSSCP